MALLDMHTAVHRTGLIRVAEGARAALKAVSQPLISISDANRRLKAVERLQQLSDAELARMDLRREDIVRHVFRDVLNS